MKEKPGHSHVHCSPLHTVGIHLLTYLEKPGSNICYLSNSADSRGYENTGKGTTKTDETRMSSEKEERLIEPDFEGREYRKQD